MADPQSVSALRKVDFAAVRSHSETLLILDRLRLDKRIRLLASHFLALPGIVRNTDLGVVMPGSLAREIAAKEQCAVIEPRVSHRELIVSLHYSKRRDQDAGHRWLTKDDSRAVCDQLAAAGIHKSDQRRSGGARLAATTLEYLQHAASLPDQLVASC